MDNQPRASKSSDVTVVLFPGANSHEANLQLEKNIAEVAQDPNLKVNLIGLVTSNPETYKNYEVDPAHKGPVAVVIRKFKRTVLTGSESPEELRRILKGEKS